MLKAEFPSIFELWTVDRRAGAAGHGRVAGTGRNDGCKPARSRRRGAVRQPAGGIPRGPDRALCDRGAARRLCAAGACDDLGRPADQARRQSRASGVPRRQHAVHAGRDPRPLRSRPQPGAGDGRPGGELGRFRRADGALARRVGGEWRRGAAAADRADHLADPAAPDRRACARALPQARVHLFDPLAGYGGAAGRSWCGRTLERAQVVVSLDDDLLGPGPMQAINGRAWGERHGDAGRGASACSCSWPRPRRR